MATAVKRRIKLQIMLTCGFQHLDRIQLCTATKTITTATWHAAVND
jgi:hypothetical protein